MKVLVTGGSGFIGSYFYDSLKALGHEIVILDLVQPRWDASAATVVQGDIRDADAARRAMEGCQGVVHLAAAHHDFGISREEFFSVNEHGAEVLCRVASDLDVKDFCFYSTVATYGEAPEPRTEQTKPRPNSDYGESKLAAEKVFQKWVESGADRRCLVIRPTVTFGPRNFANMYSLIRQIRSGKFFRVGSGTNIKSLSYVENIVEASLALWGMDPRHPEMRVAPGFHVFNYIDKPDLQSREIVSCVYRSLGKTPPKVSIPLWLGVLMGLPFDLVIKVTGRNLPVSTARIRKLCTQTKFESDKIREAGFTPSVSLPEGIDRMVKWYLEKGQYEKPTGPQSAG